MNDYIPWTNEPVWVERIDDEEGDLDCICGEVYHYKGWNSPETVQWANQHDGPTGQHGFGVTMTKDCSCGLLDHPRKKCAPPDYWI